jgi:hypothetical protein
MTNNVLMAPKAPQRRLTYARQGPTVSPHTARPVLSSPGARPLFLFGFLYHLGTRNIFPRPLKIVSLGNYITHACLLSHSASVVHLEVPLEANLGMHI